MGEKREVWRLYLENASEDIKAEEKEKEQHMYRDVGVFRLVHCHFFYEAVFNSQHIFLSLVVHTSQRLP